MLCSPALYLREGEHKAGIASCKKTAGKYVLSLVAPCILKGNLHSCTWEAGNGCGLLGFSTSRILGAGQDSKEDRQNDQRAEASSFMSFTLLGALIFGEKVIKGEPACLLRTTIFSGSKSQENVHRTVS